jgi:hypothetical protein
MTEVDTGTARYWPLCFRLTMMLALKRISGVQQIEFFAI